MAKLFVRTFGKISLHRDQQTCSVIEPRKAMELLCYLLLNPARPQPRESLAETIWGETPRAQSRKYLRQTLWQLQTCLADSANNDSVPVLLTEANWVQINPQAELWADVIEFEKAYTRVQESAESPTGMTLYNGLKQAVELYQGDFFESCYEDWCLYERERLQNIYLTMLEKLMSCCENAAKYEEALSYGEQILRYETASERTHRQMARLYYQAGKRTHAIRQLQRCIQALKDEFGVPPAQVTLELYEKISQGRSLEGIIDSGAVKIPVSQNEVITQLEQLRHSLTTFYQQTNQEIDSLMNVLQAKPTSHKLLED